MLCDPHDPSDIARKIVYLLKNKKLMKDIGINARKHIEEKFSIQNIVEENLQYYQSCIEDYYNI